MLLDHYHNVRALTEKICQPLKVEDHIPQPAEFVSPPKWHLAHTTWFFETFILLDHADGYTPFHPKYSYLFNSYYNTLGDRTQRDQRGALSRPTVEEVLAYRSHVDKHMDALLRNTEVGPELSDLLEVGINHEQQHQELLLSDIKYILGNDPLFPVYDATNSIEDCGSIKDEWLQVEGGVYEIGHAGAGFGYDNEFERHKVHLRPYEIRDGLVSNAEYLAFMNDGGYRRHEFWLDEGWAWVNDQGIEAPLHWHRQEQGWVEFRLSGLGHVDPKRAVNHVSHYEAAAFAEWTGRRLPTEAEWEAASGRFEWGHRWEHTNSAYLPYPGFKKPAGAVGEYNGKFMMNQMVLRGASKATSPGHSRSTYRNFFHPHLQWQFTGIRLAKDA